MDIQSPLMQANMVVGSKADWVNNLDAIQASGYSMATAFKMAAGVFSICALAPGPEGILAGGISGITYLTSAFCQANIRTEAEARVNNEGENVSGSWRKLRNFAVSCVPGLSLIV